MNDHKPENSELTPGTLVDCPTCGLPSEITDRFTLGGVPEPVEHVKVVCIRRHWYTVPIDMFHTCKPVSEDTRTAGITGQR